MSLLSGRLSANSARFFAIFTQNLALYNKKKLSPSVLGPMCDRFPRKFDVQTSYKPNLCCEHQISSGNLSHDSAFDRTTLLFNYSELKVKVSIFFSL